MFPYMVEIFQLLAKGLLHCIVPIWIIITIHNKDYPRLPQIRVSLFVKAMLVVELY